MESTAVDTSKLVSVVWHDAVAYGVWHEPDAVPSICNTIGFLVSKNEYALEVASTVSDDVVNGSIVIPVGMLISYDEVELVKKNVKKTKH